MNILKDLLIGFLLTFVWLVTGWGDEQKHV